MNIDEREIARAMILHSDDAGINKELARLYHHEVKNPVLRMLVNARFQAVIKNSKEPDIASDFYALGGSEEQYFDILYNENRDDPPITVSCLRGSITRVIHSKFADKYDDILTQFRKGLVTHKEVIAEMALDLSTEQASLTLKEIAEYCENHEGWERIRTGFEHLDRMQVLYRTQPTILAARTSVGKSSFSLAIIKNALELGYNIYFASPEMSYHQIWKRLSDCAGSKAELLNYPGKLRVLSKGSISVPEIASEVNGGDYDLVVVDYLQILNYPFKYSGRYEKITELSGQCRAAAQNSSAAWLILSQISRETRNWDEVPSLSDLRESGAIEQDAFAVIFLSYEKGTDINALSRQTNITVAKNREGRLGQITYKFHMAASKWEEQ